MRARGWLALAAASALVVAVAWTTATSGASFTASTSNPGNTFATASSFPGIRVASGGYTGNGADNRAITGVGFQPSAVIVKSADNSGVAEMRTSTMTGDNTKPLSGGTALTADLIQSLDSDGFTIGTSNAVNRNTRSYTWVAFKSYPGHMSLGTYTGNGTSQSVSGVGFSPEYVMMLPANNQRATQRMSGMTATYQFDADAGIATGITSLDSNGFSVGNNNKVNQSGVTYHYVAFDEDVDEMDTASYAGTGASQSITGVGFQPAYVITRASANREGAHRPSAVAGTGSQLFTATANESAGITALQSDGFQVGTSNTVNANGTTYNYVVFKDKP
jgi:hypothetical protein